MDKTFLNKILIKAQEIKASDIHLLSNLKPYARIHGEIKQLTDFQVLSAQNILNILLSILDKNLQEIFLKKLQVDFAYFNTDNNTRYRVNAFRDSKGISIVFRALNSNIPILEESDYPDIFKKIASLDKGLVLICGPTGSGKSTTIATMIDYINRNTEKHIITIEDPIEYIYESKKSIINQREIGKNVVSFAEGLKGALREDPDVILVGELRDQKTIKLALTAAERGHLVFGTLHTISASKTIGRIIDSVANEEKDIIRNMLSTSLRAVVLQTLLKKPNNSGRVPAYEILVGTTAIRNLIRDNKIFQIDSMIQTGSKFGMTTMKDYIQKLIQKNKVDRKLATEMIMKSDEDVFRVEEPTKKYSYLEHDPVFNNKDPLYG